MAGGGVINADASALLVRFAEITGIPVIPTLMGWGTIPDDYPLMAGMVGLQTAHRYGNATMPYAFPKERLAEALDRHGLVQVLHNLPAGDWDAGERGIACHPDRVGEFRDGVGRAIEYATALRCPQVNCLVGIPPAGADPERVRRTVADNLAFAARELERAGIKLLIEPVNAFDVPGFWLSRPDQAVALMDEIGSSNLFLQYDLYHQQRTAGELLGTHRRLKDRIAHIQVADNPGRGEPGTGEINDPFLFDALDGDGYGGRIGCEYRPRGDTLAGLGWMRPYLRARGTAAA